jgi:hypothetical protein
LGIAMLQHINMTVEIGMQFNFGGISFYFQYGMILHYNENLNKKEILTNAFDPMYLVTCAVDHYFVRL